jgi:hypothetical protein
MWCSRRCSSTIRRERDPLGPAGGWIDWFIRRRA